MKTIAKLALAASVCLLPLQLSAATVTISGKQTSGSAGSNAKLSGQAVTLSSPMTIASVSGSNAGFWIQKGTQIVARFSKPNDSAAVGTPLQPGTYSVYPNLSPGSTSATVTLTLK